MEHPEIEMTLKTGYPSWMQEDVKELRCCECGMALDAEEDDIYTTRTHATLCLDCLKMLHRKW